MASKNIAVVNSYCVACGSCVKVCPMQAITIYKGIIANIDYNRCVGCAKCIKECPAGAIDLKERGVMNA